MQQSNGSKKQTLVEEGTELKGTLKSSCQVVVNGSIDGQIEAPALTVTQTGTVLGVVRAKQLRSEGTLAGDIDAEDVYLSGTVRSNTMIRAKKLEVKLMPERGKLEVTFGECLIEVGEDPAVREEPVAEEAQPAAEPVVEAPLAAAPEDEPTWSEPPPREQRAEARAEGGSAEPAPEGANTDEAPAVQAEAAGDTAEAVGAESESESAASDGEGSELDAADGEAAAAAEATTGRGRKKKGSPRDSQAPPPV